MSQDTLAPGRLRVGINRAGETRDHLVIFVSPSGNTDVSLDTYGAAANTNFQLGRARGTPAAPAIVAAGDILGELEFNAYTNAWHHCAEIRSEACGTPAAGVIPDSDIQLRTTAAGAADTIRVRIMPAGQVAIGDGATQTEANITANGIGKVWIAHNDSTTSLGLHRASADSGSASVQFRKSRGTLASPATVQTGDEMIYLMGSAYTNQWHDNVGAIAFYVDGTVTAGQRPGNRINLRTGKPNAGGPSDRVIIYNNGNIALNNSGITAFGASSEGVIGVGNAAVNPTGNPTGGGVLYADAGAGKWRGSGGTTTTFGPAEPHCPVCNSDFGIEYERAADVEPDPEKRYLALCFQCLIAYMAEQDGGRAKAWIRKTKPVAVVPPVTEG